nr:XRE family transcriptional regulator [Methylorubrum zatmanii]
MTAGPDDIGADEEVNERLSGVRAVSGQLGRTVQRLRKSYKLSLSKLAEQSGVPKSLISEIERNETNPTLATIWRLSQALDISIEKALSDSEECPFIEKTSRADTPLLVSEDGKVRLAITGWVKTIEWLQWYEVAAHPGGMLVSEPHRQGSVESLSVREGTFEVEVDASTEVVAAGETLRYRCDRPHIVRCTSDTPGSAIMLVVMRAQGDTAFTV